MDSGQGANWKVKIENDYFRYCNGELVGALPMCAPFNQKECNCSGGPRMFLPYLRCKRSPFGVKLLILMQSIIPQLHF